MVRNDFVMRSQFMNIFNGVLSSGLVSKWQRNLHIGRKLDDKSDDVRPINMLDFYPALIFVSIFLVTSIVVATLEHIIQIRIRTSRVKYIWEFLDKLISGQRCFFVLKTNRKNDGITPFLP